MNIFNNRKQLMTFISWTAVIVWMILIFNLSSQVAKESNSLSKGITEIVIETIEKATQKTDFDVSKFNSLLRKNAHFFVYLVLGILVMNAIRRSGLYGVRGFILVLGICILYAISDEVHQLFVPGRGPQVEDVLIDSVGTIVGVGMYSIVDKVIHNS